jgi:hypothetical protein
VHVSLPCLCYFARIELLRTTDTTIRAVGKRAHAMHLMTAFSTQCVIATVIGYEVLRCRGHFGVDD